MSTALNYLFTQFVFLFYQVYQGLFKHALAKMTAKIILVQAVGNQAFKINFKFKILRVSDLYFISEQCIVIFENFLCCFIYLTTIFFDKRN